MRNTKMMQAAILAMILSAQSATVYGSTIALPEFSIDLNDDNVTVRDAGTTRVVFTMEGTLSPEAMTRIARQIKGNAIHDLILRAAERAAFVWTA